MGNSHSISSHSAFDFAQKGDTRSLQTLLQEAQRRPGTVDLRSYVEHRDPRGLTPLMAAAAGGYVETVRLLLRYGASVHAVSSAPEVTTALHLAANGHLAAVDALVNAGANPFCENGQRFTAMDVAVASRATLVLRRLEAAAPFAGISSVKEIKWGGLGTAWQLRHCVVMHRFPGPATPVADRVVRKLLCCYKSAEASEPYMKAWMDGAEARPVIASRPFEPQRLAVVLHTTHIKPEGTYVTRHESGGWTIHLRPASDSAADLLAQQRLATAINTRFGSQSATQQPSPRASQPSPRASQPVSSYTTPQRPSSRPTGHAVWGSLGEATSAARAPPSLHAQSGETDEQLAARLQSSFDAEAAHHFSVSRTSPPRRQPSQSSPTAASHRRTQSSGQSRVSSASMQSNLERSSAEPQLAPTPGRIASDPAPAGLPAAPTAGQVDRGRPANAMPPGVKEEDVSDEDACVVCLSSRATTGFLHGGTVHRCCCADCAEDVASTQNKLCPVCRQPFSAVLKVF